MSYLQCLNQSYSHVSGHLGFYMVKWSDLFLWMVFKLMPPNESVRGMEPIGQSQQLKNFTSENSPTKKIYWKDLPCSCPILFSRSDTSISTSMISKSFEMHSLIINPVNEFFINPNEFLYFILRLLSDLFVTIQSLLNHFPVTFWPRLFLSWPWPLSGYKSVSS